MNLNASSLSWLLLAALGVPVLACEGTPGVTCRGSKCGTGGTGGDAGGPGVGGEGAGGRGAGGQGADGQGADGQGGDPSMGGSGGSGGGASDACRDPVPLLPGVDTGIYRCDGGFLHRAEAKSCPSELPRDNSVTFPSIGAAGAPGYTTSDDECAEDRDCDALERCELVHTNWAHCQGPPYTNYVVTPDYARRCLPTCVTDADCDAAEVCICGSEFGTCHATAGTQGCHTDADCSDGALCLDNGRVGQFGDRPLFSCSRPDDDCSACTDGSTLAFCAYQEEGPKKCQTGPICGRPFLVEYVERLASWEEDDRWQDGALAATPNDVPTSLQARLAEHWAHIGLMEHASIAAFARFTLELLALGAPPTLVEASNAALVDETRHARLAFTLASAFAGRALGPGPLAIAGALDSAGNPEALLRTTFREGCVGETRAALEAARSAESCEDPSLRRVLTSIASDESRHAELAWRVVQFLVQSRPSLRAALESEVTRLVATDEQAPNVSSEARDLEAERFGLLGPSVLAQVHAEALRGVILPCARSLLASLPNSAALPSSAGLPSSAELTNSAALPNSALPNSAATESSAALRA